MKTKSILALTACACAVSFSAPALADAKQTCVDMVKKAATFLASNGKDKLLDEINNPKGMFTDGTTYLFATDYQPNFDPKTGHIITLAHGVNPKLVGKDMADLRDADGVYFVKKLLERANSKEGEGWTDYKWPHPVTKQIEPKSTYTKRVEPLVINCGVYK